MTAAPGTGAPRVLAIMGSGETTPTMVTPHRRLLERAGPGAVPVLLDTPFGFQENADDLTDRARRYFQESVGTDMDAAAFRSGEEVGTLEHERTLVRLREARYVFSGPGSPTYALRQWRTSQVPEILTGKLRTGGVIVFASAAAVTLGEWAVPVYEVYKVGAAPEWHEGLELMNELGVRVAVIPHFDNAEGGTHDTRYCYLGERRLSLLEERLPDDAFVLGVDEHTVLVLDLGAGTASVEGRGVVSVRRRGATTTFPAGEVVPIGDLQAAAMRPRRCPSPPRAGDAEAAEAEQGEVAPASEMITEADSPLLAEVDRLEGAFGEALEEGRAEQAVEAMLALDDTIVAWSRDSFESDHLDRARSVLRSMIVRLGERAIEGLRDPNAVVAPFVDALLDVRQSLRRSGDYDAADSVRDRLLAAGVEVRDTAEGTEWRLTEPL